MTPGFTVSVIVFGLLVIVMYLFARFWQTEYEQIIKEKRELTRKYSRCLDELNDEQYMRMRLHGMYQDLIRENDRMRNQLHNLNFNKRNSTSTADKDLIDAAFEECYDREDSQNAIAELMRKKKFCAETATDKEKQKIYAFLMRKGFSYEDIRQVIQVSGWNA